MLFGSLLLAALASVGLATVATGGGGDTGEGVAEPADLQDNDNVNVADTLSTSNDLLDDVAPQSDEATNGALSEIEDDPQQEVTLTDFGHPWQGVHAEIQDDGRLSIEVSDDDDPNLPIGSLVAVDSYTTHEETPNITEYTRNYYMLPGDLTLESGNIIDNFDAGTEYPDLQLSTYLSSLHASPVASVNLGTETYDPVTGDVIAGGFAEPDVVANVDYAILSVDVFKEIGGDEDLTVLGATGLQPDTGLEFRGEHPPNWDGEWMENYFNPEPGEVLETADGNNLISIDFDHIRTHDIFEETGPTVLELGQGGDVVEIGLHPGSDIGESTEILHLKNFDPDKDVIEIYRPIDPSLDRATYADIYHSNTSVEVADDQSYSIISATVRNYDNTGDIQISIRVDGVTNFPPGAISVYAYYVDKAAIA